MPNDESRLVLSIDAKGAINTADDLADSLEDVEEQGDKTSKSFMEMTRKSVDLKQAYKGMAAAALAYLSIDTAKEVINTSNETLALSKSLGLTTEELSRLQYAASVTVGETEFLADAISDMNEKIGEARIGSGTLKDQLELTNPALLQQVMNTKSTSEAFRLLVGELERVENVQDRTILSTELFAEAGKKMVQIAELGSDGLAELEREADRLGITLNSNAAESMKELTVNLEIIKQRLQGGAREIITGMIPALMGLTGANDDSKDSLQKTSIVLENIGITVGNAITMFATLGRMVPVALQAVLGAVGFAGKSIQAVFDKDLSLKDVAEGFSQVGDEIEDDLARILSQMADGTQNLKSFDDEASGLSSTFGDITSEVEQLVKKMMELQKSQEDAAKSTVDLTNATLSYLESQDDQLLKMRLVNEAMEKLNFAVEQNWITQENADEILREYTKSLNDSAGSIEQYSSKARKAANETTNLADVQKEWVKFGQTALVGLSNQLIDGGDDWRSYAKVVVQAVGEIIAQMIILRAAETSIGAISKSGTGQVSSGTPKFSKGAVFTDGVEKFADGAVVTRPTMFPMSSGKTGLMGEAGAEAIMPLSRTSDGALGVRMSGGGGGGIVQQFTYNVEAGTSPETIKELGNFSRKNAEMIKNEILTDIARGGKFSRAVARRG